jgi:hypothetical protein
MSPKQESDSTRVRPTSVLDDSHSPSLVKKGCARGLGLCLRLLSKAASRRSRIAASPPSSERASKKVAGKTDIFEIFNESSNNSSPPKGRPQANRRDKKETQGLRPCNTGKPINGGVCG